MKTLGPEDSSKNTPKDRWKTDSAWSDMARRSTLSRMFLGMVTSENIVSILPVTLQLGLDRRGQRLFHALLEEEK